MFNPRLIIDSHFSKIINDIDIKVEELLAEKALNDIDKNEINELRSKQIVKIEEFKKFNIESYKCSEEAFSAKWKDLIEDNNIDDEDKLDIIKNDLILHDGVLIEDPDFKSKISLLLFPWFVDKRALKMLR